MEITTASTLAQLEQVKNLLEQYWAGFGFTPCFQNFGEEVNHGDPTLDTGDAGNCLVRFRSNRWVGWLIFLGLTADMALAAR